MSSVLKTKSDSRIRANWWKAFVTGDEDTIRQFATSIEDFNPLHHDCDAAHKAGLLGIIAPGVMMVGFVSSTIADEIPGVQVCHMDMKFSKPLYALSAVVVNCDTLMQNDRFAKVEVTIEDGADCIAKGTCLLMLPQ